MLEARFQDTNLVLADTTSIIAILVAALPWAVIAQPLLQPVHFSTHTTFTFATSSSALAVLAALLACDTKSMLTLYKDGKAKSFTLYIHWVRTVLFSLCSCCS